MNDLWSSRAGSDLPLDHPGLQRLYGYWNERRGQAQMPTRGNIDPIDISDLLRNLYLVDVEGEPPRFRYRVAGTELESTLGRKLTGRYVDDGVLGGLTDVAHGDMTKIVQEPQMIYRAGRLLVSEEPLFKYVRLALPLGDPITGVNFILGAVFYTWLSERSRSAQEAQSEALSMNRNASQRWVGEVVSMLL